MKLHDSLRRLLSSRGRRQPINDLDSRKRRTLRAHLGQFEPLERRTLLSVAAKNGVLTIIGGAAADTITLNFGNPGEVKVSGGACKADAKKIQTIVVQALGGDDLVQIQNQPIGADGTPIAWSIDGERATSRSSATAP